MNQSNLNSRTDEDLIILFQQVAHPEIPPLLFNRYSTRMVRFTTSFIRNGTIAEDIVQECFIRIFTTLNRYDPKKSFATWAFRILRNLCIDETRRKHKPIPLVQCEEPTSNEPRADEQILEKERNRTIHAALQKLQAHEKEAVTLRMFGDLDFSQVAECLGIAPDAAKKRVYRGLQALKKELEQVGFCEKD